MWPELGLVAGGTTSSGVQPSENNPERRHADRGQHPRGKTHLILMYLKVQISTIFRKTQRIARGIRVDENNRMPLVTQQKREGVRYVDATAFDKEKWGSFGMVRWTYPHALA